MSVHAKLVTDLTTLQNNPGLYAQNHVNFKTKLALRAAAFQLGVDATNLHNKPDLVTNVLIPKALLNAQNI